MDRLTDLHYYVPRTSFVDHLYQQVCGDDLGKGGHYITVWAPRQTGKTRLLHRFVQELQAWFARLFPPVQTWGELSNLITAQNFSKPLILLLDEFDALAEPFINRFANESWWQRAPKKERGDTVPQLAEVIASPLHGVTPSLGQGTCPCTTKLAAALPLPG